MVYQIWLLQTGKVRAMSIALDTSRELERQHFIGADTTLLVAPQKTALWRQPPCPGVAAQTADALTVCGLEEWR